MSSNYSLCSVNMMSSRYASIVVSLSSIKAQPTANWQVAQFTRKVRGPKDAQEILSTATRFHKVSAAKYWGEWYPRFVDGQNI